MAGDRILGAIDCRTNAELLAHVRKLGLRAGWWPFGTRVLDPTFGEGKWWKALGTATADVTVVGHDLEIDGVDFRRLPYPDESFDVIAFDPPYVGVGGVDNSTLPDFLNAYGLTEKSKPADAVAALICAGLAECARVCTTEGVVLVKCMNYVTGGHYRAIADDVLAYARGPLGLVLHDEFVHLSGEKPQPLRCRRCKGERGRYELKLVDGVPTNTWVHCAICGGTGDVNQHHARRNYTQLYVLRKPTLCPKTIYGNALVWHCALRNRHRGPCRFPNSHCQPRRSTP